MILYKKLLKSLMVILVLFFVAIEVQAQQVTVRGTVTDAQTGNPLVGTNVLVVGTTSGAITGVNGHYRVNVSSLQDTLRFSFIGYKTKKVPIEGRTTINVEMKTSVYSEKQLVVIGYGTQQKMM